ncbi:MAG TPA: hypothetical protein VJ788_06270 [Gemmatimonadota bacterium]|nr:hypothetical protein [Gemmatimonadota bacterium]
MNETSTQTRVRSDVADRAARGSSTIAILTRGWGPGLIRGGLAFAVMVALGQAVAFAVNLAQGGGVSAGSTAKLGWLYFGWFHHADVTTHLTSTVDGVRRGSALSGGSGLTADVGLAMMLGTFLAVAILYRGGRVVADGVGGGAAARILHGMKVAPAYAIAAFVVSGLVTIDITVPRNALVTGSLQTRPWDLSWFVLPLLVAVAAGGAGGLRSARHELLSIDPWGRRAAGAVAGGLRMFVLGLVLSFVGLVVLAVVRPSASRTYFETVSGPPTAQTAVIAAHHVLLLPNQSMWVLVPAMGGCDGLHGENVSASFLCYSNFPSTTSVTPEGLRSGTAVVRAEFETAPSGYLLFLLVPAVSVVLGGRYAARKRARLKWEAVGVGAASGVLFAILIAVGSWFASVSAGLTWPAADIRSVSVQIGPGLWAAGLLALAWGVVGGALGGWLGGRTFPPRAWRPEHSSLLARRAAGVPPPGAGRRG